MTRRIKSLELMQYLQPFVQGQVITAAEARNLVEDYKKGDNKSLINLIFSPTMPMQFSHLAKKLGTFIQ